MPSRLTVVFVSLLLATPVIIFWLWLVILPTRVAIECPEECRCKADGYYIKCSDSGLNSIPSNIPTHVRLLVRHGNNITYFLNSTFVFRGLVDLQILKADLCEVRKIELGAFSGLTKLIILSMKGNKISEIIPGTFENISHLEYLRLDNNVIVNLESDVFNGLVNLKHINLKGNKLQYLHPDTFLALSNLQHLNLSENVGLQIPSDRPFINSFCLKYLDVSGCNITSVSLETFSNIIALEWLDLSENNLRNVVQYLTVMNLKNDGKSEITPGTFENFTRYEYLHLDNNRTKHSDINIFYGLFN